MRIASPLMQFVDFNKGLDLVTPPLKAAPGSISICENFEIGINGGVDTVAGYESFDGHISPSSAVYQTYGVNITSGTFAVGDFLTAPVSGAQSTIVGIDDGHFYLRSTFRTLVDGEVIDGPSGSATITMLPAGFGGAPTPKLNALYKTEAAAAARLQIMEVPGSGPILGVWRLNYDTFAVRGDGSGNAVIHIAADGGWTPVSTGAVVLADGGKYETTIHNFGGAAGASKIYGCDGVNKGFEFDGTNYLEITTGMATDTPSHVATHKNHLFFSFDGSAQHSSISDPLAWSPVTGAGELAVGDTITGFMKEPGVDGGSALVIYSRNSSNVLYGSSLLDWNLVKYRDEVGAYERSIQQLGFTVFMDDSGITSLKTTQQYGNFQHSSLSKIIQPLIVQKKDLVVCSCICRNKNQYRVFFSDGTAIYVTMNGNKIAGMMPVRMSHTPTCMFSVEDANGDEIIMFGAEDGKVYQMERGTSFDGDNIYFFMRLHFLSMGSPRIKKAFKGVALEVSGDGYSEAQMSYDLNYSDYRTAQPEISQGREYTLSSSRWDEFTWDSFYWDNVSLSVSEFDLSGSGENISLTIMGDGNFYSPLRLSGAIIRYINRRQLR